MPVRARLSMSHGTQSVPLPDPVAFDRSVTEVEIEIVGDARVIRAASSRVAAFWDSDVRVSDDFGGDQPVTPQERPAMSTGTASSVGAR